MNESLQTRIEKAQAAYKEKNGTDGKALLLGADEFKEFVSEFCPAVDADPDAITTTQFLQFRGLRVVIVVKTSYVGVA